MQNPAKTKTTFNGKSFEDMGIVVEMVHDPMPEMREDMEEKVGQDGSYLRGLTMGPREITLECRAFEDRWSDFDSLMADIAGWLVTEGDRKMVLRSHPDHYYMAHYVSASEGERQGGTGIGGFELTFRASDPARYGERRSMVIPSGGTKFIMVGGTHGADVRISTSAARGDGSMLWGVRIDGSEIRVPASRTSNGTIVISSVDHTVTINGSPSMLTLDSDWPELQPGRHKIVQAFGTGAATISWVQRYV